MKKIVGLVFIFFLQSPLFADTVTLRDGRVLHGRISEYKKHARDLKMDVYYESMTIPQSAILSVEKEETTPPPSQAQGRGQGSSFAPRAPIPSLTREQIIEIEKRYTPKQPPPPQE